MDVEIFQMLSGGPDDGPPWRVGYAFTAPRVALSSVDVELVYEAGGVRVTQRGEPDGPGPWTAVADNQICALLGLIAARYGYVATFQPVEDTPNV